MVIVKKIIQYQKDFGCKYLIKKIYFRLSIKYRLGKKYFSLAIARDTRRQQEDWKPDKITKISIVVPLYNTPPVYLRELIESIQAQTYSDWELCLADASEQMKKAEIFDLIQEYSVSDTRIHYKDLPDNDGISNNTNRAIEMSTGDYIALADHDDILHPSALYYVMKEINQHQADFVYTDELSFVKKPSCVQSIHLKPDFSKENFRNNNYICHFTVFQRTLLDQTGVFRKEFDGSQDYDLFLRLTEKAKKICHVPKVLYYWRCHAGSVASQVGVKPYTVEAGRKALEEHLERQSLEAEVKASAYGPFYQISYEISPESRVLVLTEKDAMVDWLRDQTKNIPYEVAVLSVQSLQTQEKAFRTEWDMVVLLRDGYNPIQGDGKWITALLECLQPEENFAASPVVYDSEGKIYFAGYCYNNAFNENIRPIFRGMSKRDPGYMNRAAFRQNVSLLGGAALAVRGKVMQQLFEKWMETETFDAVRKRLFSDSLWFSFCMTMKERKGNCIITPYGSFECDTAHREEYKPCTSTWEQPEWKAFMKKWEMQLNSSDPNMNPWMTIFGKYYFLW